ncbi:hypothetical protein KCP75_12695 [Salmonella enterica subsp. enterica]|nr:hypothetical protein KCP75_12695 [Salmonella enterica subsp. enterica]
MGAVACFKLSPHSVIHPAGTGKILTRLIIFDAREVSLQKEEALSTDDFYDLVQMLPFAA